MKEQKKCQKPMIRKNALKEHDLGHFDSIRDLLHEISSSTSCKPIILGSAFSMALCHRLHHSTQMSFWH